MIKEYLRLCKEFDFTDPVTVDSMRDKVIPTLKKRAVGFEHAEDVLTSKGALSLARECAAKAAETRDALAIAYQRLAEVSYGV